MENKYKEGSIVYAVDDKMLKLVVRRYVDRVYYCTVCDVTPAEERVYFERELVDTKDTVEGINLQGVSLERKLCKDSIWLCNTESAYKTELGEVKIHSPLKLKTGTRHQ